MIISYKKGVNNEVIGDRDEWIKKTYCADHKYWDNGRKIFNYSLSLRY